MNSQIERVIANGKPLAVIKKLLKEEYLRLDRVKYDEAIKAEYDKLFMVDAEVIKDVFNEEIQEFDTIIVTEKILAKDAPTFEEYKNETRIITEAVETTYDEVEAKANEYIKSKYAELRANAYPAIEEQLDMQYKDSLDGGTRFKDAIEAVKLMYPKD